MADTVARTVSSRGSRPGGRRRAPTRRRASRWRRARGLGGTVGVTTMSALLPGSGYLWTGRRVFGLVVLTISLAVLGLGGWYFGRDPHAALQFVFDPVRLKTAAAVVSAGFVVWAFVVVTTYLMVRPVERRPLHTLVGSLFVCFLCVVVAAPVAVAARYSMVQADLVGSVFQHNTSATAPKHVTEKDPWSGRTRVNVLLLGGDGGVDRQGVRTDSMILMSMDTRSGRTVMFSLPRNMMNAPFPDDSPLHAAYPDGFRNPTGDPSQDGNWMLNAIYREVPMLHPHILGRSDNEGADALKQAVEGTLGQPVDYYVLVNLQGFRKIVDAMGGVTVNINQPIPIGGNTDLGIPPDDYLKPGPHKRLNGFQALWYTRGRYGSTDYQRMERQRCMINAIVDEAKPLNLLRRYQELAKAGKQIIRTDIPSVLLPAFVDLSLKIKDASVRSVVFQTSDKFFSGDPDFRWMRKVTRKALRPPRQH
ncbi:MAG: LCP family protein, partial [Nocardioidaceae bacterium]|nr:LCP family protein [Nocardioidaceae bacterium]